MGFIRRDKTKYRKKQWIVFLITDNGRTVPIRHFKGMVQGLVVLGAALLVLIGVLISLCTHLVDEKSALERRVASQAQEKNAIQKEKDFLMAQLAIAESKLKIGRAALRETAAVAEAHPDEAPIETADSIQAEAANTPGEKALPEIESDAPASGLKTKPAKISVDNFLICYDPNAGRVHVEFKVIHTGEEKQPVSGYAYTILKDGTEERAGWLVFPETQLLNGMPVQTRGMRFRIYNFRTMKFSAKHDNPNPYTYATIFVHRQDTGELMIERDFEINSIPPCP